MNYSDHFLQLEKDLVSMRGIESVSTELENSRAEYTINFKSRSVALIIAEIDTEVNQVRVRFANKVHVDEWKDENKIVSKLKNLIKKSLKSHFDSFNTDHSDVPEVTVYPRNKTRAGPEVVEQIFMVVQDPKLFSIFVKRINSAKKVKGKILPWIKHAKGLGWNPGEELPDKSKKALPLILKKISSKGTKQLIEVIEATQRNRHLE